MCAEVGVEVRKVMVQVMRHVEVRGRLAGVVAHKVMHARLSLVRNGSPVQARVVVACRGARGRRGRLKRRKVDRFEHLVF
jgi:hypothetical protein